MEHLNVRLKTVPVLHDLEGLRPKARCKRNRRKLRACDGFPQSQKIGIGLWIHQALGSPRHRFLRQIASSLQNQSSRAPVKIPPKHSSEPSASSASLSTSSKATHHPMPLAPSLPRTPLNDTASLCPATFALHTSPLLDPQKMKVHENSKNSKMRTSVT